MRGIISKNSKTQVEQNTLSEFLTIILGPTASGKTSLAIQIAAEIDAEIISADSRQVYKRMDIGTGKDLEEYKDIPFHLINILEPGQKYNVDKFQKDFHKASASIKERDKKVILCGGTGLYIESIIHHKPYTQIPKNPNLRTMLDSKDQKTLLDLLNDYSIPTDLKIDTQNKKRIIRGIEILQWIKNNGLPDFTDTTVKRNLIIGLNPPIEARRTLIEKRLNKRLNEGLINEVKALLSSGISHETLQYYGLEYKYVSLYLTHRMSYQELKVKLLTEINRYAKRQMTFFRKMEKQGLRIHWIANMDPNVRLCTSLKLIDEYAEIYSTRELP